MQTDGWERRRSGTHSVPALAAGARHTATVTPTVPAATPRDAYVLLACADDLGKVMEGDETNNCTASTTPATIGP